MPDASDYSDRMAELQKMRVALVILTSQENARLLSRRQRVAGKEIELMCAERDLKDAADRDRLEELHAEEAALRQALHETEQDLERLAGLMVQVSADIAALCQA